MSVYNIKSTYVTNRDASPTVLTNPEKAQGLAKVVIGCENTGNSGASIGAAGTAIRLLSIPSNARIHSMEYGAGDLGTSSLNVAVWYPADIPQGGYNSPAASLEATLISSSAFATAIAGVDTSIAWTDAMGANAGPTLGNRMKPLWQLVGLSSDPEIDLDIGFSVQTAVVQNGYVGLRAVYVD